MLKLVKKGCFFFYPLRSRMDFESQLLNQKFMLTETEKENLFINV